MRDKSIIMNADSCEVPDVLVEKIKLGQVVLFLGAGASKGALNSNGESPPIGNELKDLILNKFLSPEYKDRTLAQIVEFAISETDLFTVQEYIATIFRDFYPSEFHKLIPKFVWSAIATTNYDLILERAYEAEENNLQNLVGFKKNTERIEEKLKKINSVLYLKLHGCITDINDPKIPLILTTDQYITHRKGRSLLFERLQALAYNYTFLWVGYSLNDPNIRSIILELDELNEAKPRSYMVSPNIGQVERRYWENEKKIQCIDLTFDKFLYEIEKRIPTHLRVLSTLYSLYDEASNPIKSKFRVSNKNPSQSLQTFLSRDVDYIHKNFKTTDVDPKAFYKGYFNDLSPIILNFDVKRSLSDGIMSEVFLTTEEEKEDSSEFYIIKGHAGSGKSVLLKRLAWDASVDYEKLCLLLTNTAYPEYEPLYELYNLCKERIFLFIDTASKHSDTIENFMRRARKDKFPLTIIGTERGNEWNTNCENLEPYLTHSYELKYLSQREIVKLIELLAKYKSLGHLEGLSLEDQKKELSKKAGRQLLVALHEATLGKPLSDIVFDEYNKIGSQQAKSLYLSVCILHRLGVDTRAGLISRVHGIPLASFQEKLFQPLEYIVFASKDKLIGDYVYRSRHPHIAEIVFERVLSDYQDKYDEFIRIINVLDTGYESDRQALRRMINAKELQQLFSDPQMIRQIYKSATERYDSEAAIFQQEAIFEMSNSGGSVDKATILLQKAHKLAPGNRSIAHSLSELALKKSEIANTVLEKKKYRNDARKIARDLIDKEDVTSHSYHTLIKADIDELSEMIELESETIIENKIKEIERIIAHALQKFPNDSYILDSESKFSMIINNNPKAFECLKKAFNINKRNPYIALRLARMHETNESLEDAIKVLKDCLEENPNDKSINFKLAMLLSGVYHVINPDIKHHLRRSFTEGDSNFVAQFWFARLLYLEGDFEGARKLFRNLDNRNIDIRIKREPRGLVKHPDGSNVMFQGFISSLESSYGFIIRDGDQQRIFLHSSNSTNDEWLEYKVDKRVNFNLAFTYKGPLALHVKLEFRTE